MLQQGRRTVTPSRGSPAVDSSGAPRRPRGPGGFSSASPSPRCGPCLPVRVGSTVPAVTFAFQRVVRRAVKEGADSMHQLSFW